MPAPISFAPRRGAILICDFGIDPNEAYAPGVFRPEGVIPEMTKIRRAVVVSADTYNVRTRLGINRFGPGLCIVVPVSATASVPVDQAHIPMLASRYRAMTKDGWAKCNFPVTVSHNRLYRPRIKGTFISEYVTKADMAAIEGAVRLAFDL